MSTGIIIDVCLIAVFLIAVVIGLVKGFNKVFMGFLSEIGGLAVAAALCSVIANKLLAIPQFANLSLTFANIFKAETANVTVTSLEELSALLTSGVWGLLAGKADYIWLKMQTYSTETLAAYGGYVMLKAITIFVCFIVLLLLVRFVLNTICKLFQKLNKHTVFKVLNMILGVVWAFSITYLLVVGVLLTGAEIVISKFMADNIAGIQAAIGDSAILKLLHDTNFIGRLISNSFSIPLPDLFPTV